MKRFLAVFLTLAMVFPLAGAALAVAGGEEEGPVITLVITDPEGNMKTVELTEAQPQYTGDGVEVNNGLPDAPLSAEVTADDGTTLTVNVDGDVKLNEGSGDPAVVIGQHTDAEITGNVNNPGGDGIAVESASDQYGEYIPNMSGIRVGGDLAASGTGITASGDAVVEVDGDVTAGHESEDLIYRDEEDRYYPEGIPGTVYTGEGIDATDDADVHVGGNLTSEATAVSTDNRRLNTNRWTDNGDGTSTRNYSSVNIENQATISVDGDVTSNHGTGIYANGMAEVTVGGSLTADDNAINSWGNSGVAVAGDVESAKGFGIVTSREQLLFSFTEQYDADGEYIEDSIRLGGTVYSEGAGNVLVGGNVTAKKSTAIYMNGESNVAVLGDVTGGAVKKGDNPGEKPEEVPEGEAPEEPVENWETAYQEAWEEAFRGVEFADEYHNGAIAVELNDDVNDGGLFVGGTVHPYEGNAPVMLRYTIYDPSEMATIGELPEMKFYELLSVDGEFFDVNVALRREFEYTYEDENTGETVTKTAMDTNFVKLSDADRSAVVEAVAQSAEYIIRTDAVNNGTISLSGASYDEEYGVYTAHEENGVGVTVRPDEGYEFSGLTATGNYTLNDNGDGTWTVVIHRGGGVTLSAVLTQKMVQEMAQESASMSGWNHPALGKTVKYGHYDFDGDGTKEDLEWKVIGLAAGGYAQLAMIAAVDEIPEDFQEEAFDGNEKETIDGGLGVGPLEAGLGRKIFGDPADTAQIRISIRVRLNAIAY